MSAVSHELIAAALAEAGKTAQLPTAEQQRIIEAPLAPALVVAGAGSGKTHTMMVRMLWLIANEQIAPQHILGLTFTRKAAGELRERVEHGITMLRAAGVLELDEFDVPEVTTYNSYANTIYRQYAMLLGRDPDAILLDEPGALGLMRSVVLDSDDPALNSMTSSPITVASNALTIARAMRENTLDGAGLIAFIDDFAARTDAFTDTRPANAAKRIANVANLRPFAHLADEFERRKRAEGFVEFADQVACATEIVKKDPSIADELRAQAAVVILDEYQDTSVGQTELLSTLFKAHPVMAVGDPKQSIYGWRGASAANMSRFDTDFHARGNRFELSVSWRNASNILAAANRVAAPLPESAGATALGPRPNADDGTVEHRFLLSDLDEAEAIADWLHERFVAAPDGAERTGAVLVRARAQIAPLAEALERRGVRHHVLGRGGLLRTPEVADLNALIRGAADEHAGNELIRLLIGAHVEVGLADIAALHDLAKQLARTTPEYRALARNQRDAARDRPEGASESESLAEALEYLRTTSDERLGDHGISAIGVERMRGLAQLLHDVRGRLALPLVDLLASTIQLAGLDTERIANPRNPVGRANLDAYLEAARAYTASNPAARLEEFFEWLDFAESNDELEEVVEVTEQKGVVQLTTIHSAKGLEWDYVVVPQLNAGQLPRVSGKEGWFGSNRLPYPLRHDAGDLPEFDLDAIRTHKEFNSEFLPAKNGGRTFVDQEVDRQIDEARRLAYVAVTRARDELLLTSCRWLKRNSKPVWPSEFFHEMVGAATLDAPLGAEPYCLVDGEPITAGFDAPDEDARKAIDKALGTNPNDESARIAWPRPAMPRDALAHARALADAVHDRASAPEPGDRSRYDDIIDLLLAERDVRRAERALELPERLGASYFHDLLDNPLKTARQAARPLPNEPYTATLVGNLFHTWVESLFTSRTASAATLDGLDFDDEDYGEASISGASDDDRTRLEQLKAIFFRSRFNPDQRTPIAVELPIEAPLGTTTIVGKLDAVYEGDEPGTIEIVDWKTGRAPRNAEERAERELQLMLYAHAYSEGTGTPLEAIRATLYYVADDAEISITEITPKEELLARLDAARALVGGSTAQRAG